MVSGSGSYSYYSSIKCVFNEFSKVNWLPRCWFFFLSLCCCCFFFFCSLSLFHRFKDEQRSIIHYTRFSKLIHNSLWIRYIEQVKYCTQANNFGSEYSSQFVSLLQVVVVVAVAIISNVEMWINFQLSICHFQCLHWAQANNNMNFFFLECI